ncbi:glutaredoxin family protein [Candidatus Woesearchaeota archaeon]|nr:glutaredoxin family protein [Candidatus Woesearchaeota archaeon]
MKVKIYTTPTCPYCKMVKEFLKENNIEYEDVDVSTDQDAAKEMVERSGQSGVPVIDIDGELIIGFDEAKLKEKLKLGE